MIPAFSPAISLDGASRGSRCGRAPIGVTTATCASATLVASQVPPMPDLDDGDVDRRVGEGGERHRGQHLEERQPAPAAGRRPGRGTARRRRTSRGTAPASIGAAVEGDPLAHRVQVRAGEPAGAQAELAQQRVDHPGGGGLAVGAGDVDRPGRLPAASRAGRSSSRIRSRVGSMSCSGARSRIGPLSTVRAAVRQVTRLGHPRSLGSRRVRVDPMAARPDGSRHVAIPGRSGRRP